jgi:5-methylcytosine-specific restriction endonuclease McrA
MAQKQTLVLDSTYMPRSIINADRAYVIYFKGNAQIVSEYEETFGLVNKNLKVKKPSIIRVNKYVNQGYTKVPLNRQNVFKRDNYTCVYCGCTEKSALTLDHVIPQSKGGPDTWDNLVTACKRCNAEKADLTLEEYGKVIPEPKRPHYLMLLKTIKKIPEDWKPFLFF